MTATGGKLALLGDVHGVARILARAHDQAVEAGAAALIQVGDLGVYNATRAQFERAAAKFTIPVYFIDGNHEDYRLMVGWQARGEPVEWVPGLTWLPRGYVLTVAGLRVGCLGGASSIDYQYRTKGVDWFPEDEATTPDQAHAMVRAGEASGVDLLVTHAPPLRVVERHFRHEDKLQFGVPLDWTDPSMVCVEWAWVMLGTPRLVCGHMHRSVTDGRVTILDIGETLILEAPAHATIEAAEA